MRVSSNTNPACVPMDACIDGGLITGIPTPQWSIGCLSEPFLLLLFSKKLRTKSVDFVLAYTQADVKSEIFMELPIGFGVERSHPREWVIRLYKNLYGFNDTGLAWFEKLN